jgi:hypothetical protein
MRAISEPVFGQGRSKSQNSLLFSLIAGNLPLGDPFHKTASASRKSAQIDVIVY